jgi:isoquinoline 1-oxidoreductase beta subunit
MNYVPQINRRAFVVSAAAFGGGLALGMDLPFGAMSSALRTAPQR